MKIALAGIVCTCLYAVGAVLVYAMFSSNLPNIDELETTQPKRVTRVYAADGQHLMDFREENREIIREFDEIPLAMRDALISIEDRRFFTHWGIDLRRIFGAIIRNIRFLDPTKEGASTITQQLARNLYQKVGGQRSNDSLEEVLGSYARKVREQIVAVHVERLYTKREILVMYLNTVFFGHDAWGLKSAARLYFDKEIGDLQVEEC
ncbi:MAG: transglycosylase domain-containing protein, partial [Gemmatimonadetes bacterium]|nr:transglycosylase domain-containing protein [Gemmatimonadota bacterium]